MSDLYDVARSVTDDVMGEGTYAKLNEGNPDPAVRAAAARSGTTLRQNIEADIAYFEEVEKATRAVAEEEGTPELKVEKLNTAAAVLHGAVKRLRASLAATADQES